MEGVTATLCPYCSSKRADSDDHVFSDFLGGRRTIGCCAGCNSRFGHDFEAAVYQDLAPIVVQLALCGLKPPRKTTWRNAFADPQTGFSYDFHSDWTASLSKPIVERDQDGFVRRFVGRSAREVNQIAASLRLKHADRKLLIGSEAVSFRQPTLKPVSFLLGAAVRRLAVKICIGLSVLHGKTSAWVGDEERAYLLGDRSTCGAVRIGIIDYPNLNSLVPLLGNAAYLEFHEGSRTGYGVVQVFGAIQLYLAFTGHHPGPSFAVLGTLDNRTSKEMFREIQPLHLEAVPRSGEAKTLEDAKLRWKRRLDEQVLRSFGQNVLFFNERGA